MSIPFLLLLLCLPTTILAGAYDIFVFNTTIFCGHTRRFSYTLSYNIRSDNPDRPIELDEIADSKGTSDPGLLHLLVRGFYDYSLSKIPVYEPVVKITHTCFTKGQTGRKILKVNLPTTPIRRAKIECTYSFYVDITNKEGDMDDTALIKCD